MSDEWVLQESAPYDSNNVGGAAPKRDFTPIPEDKILEAELLGVQKVVKPFKDEQNNPIVRVEFAFKILDDEFKGRNIWGDTPTTFTTHPDCKMTAWVRELLAVDELPADFRFTEESIKGSRARIVTGLRTYQKDGATQHRNFVKDVIRSRDTVMAAAPAPVISQPSVLVDDEEPF